MITAREILQKGSLTARPKNTTPLYEYKTGLHAHKLDFSRDSLLYVPKNYKPGMPTPLALMLHGAGGEAEHGLNLLKRFADDNNIILFAPASLWSTWDVIAKNAFNADVIFIDRALSLVFERYNIDRSHLAIGGFSDGASYALSLGLTNGDLFTHIIAFSPGFYHTIENRGKPPIFISHGVKDSILPIAPCGRRIVTRLRRLQYEINYEEFYGEHEIPEEIFTKAVNWFLKR